MPAQTSIISEANRAGYDRWSEIYDGYRNSTVVTDDIYFPLVWSHLHDADVLEIGCGTGRHTLRLAQAGNRVTGLDLSSGMLEVARRKLTAYPQVRLIETDFMAGDMDFGDFDSVVTALVLEHIGDIAAFFRRVCRALKPGGHFYLSEIHPERIAAGTQANFTDAKTGEKVVLASFAHADADIEAAARAAGLRLTMRQEIAGGHELTAINAEWRRHKGRKMICIWTFVYERR